MALMSTDGIATLTRQDDVAAVRSALAAVLGEAVGDLDAASKAVVAEMDRVATEAYERDLEVAAACRGRLIRSPLQQALDEAYAPT